MIYLVIVVVIGIALLWRGEKKREQRERDLEKAVEGVERAAREHVELVNRILKK